MSGGALWSRPPGPPRALAGVNPASRAARGPAVLAPRGASAAAAGAEPASRAGRGVAVLGARTPTWVAAFLVLALAPGCGAKKFPPRPGIVPRAGTVVTGVASWYGPGYHGNRTSSGERFDQDALTAAHFSWAFGTRVKVTLLSTGRSVVVRINDRFPNHKKRIIDLSRGAARQIGLIGPGTGRVRLEVLG